MSRPDLQESLIEIHRKFLKANQAAWDMAKTDTESAFCSGRHSGLRDCARELEKAIVEAK